MSKQRSLFQQFNYAINENFKEGRDKHAEKKADPELTEKIYSYSSMNNLKDFSKNLSNFFKENNPDIKRIGDIKESNLQDFLNAKKEEGCSQNTLNMYRSNINKLEQIVNKTFNSVRWDVKDLETPISPKKIDPSRGAQNPISREDYNKILDYFKENKSASGDAILAQNGLGLRVEELAQIKVKNVDLEKGELKFSNTKGGKELTKNINNIKDVLMRNMDGKNPEDKIFNIKSGSINKQLNRVEDKLGLTRHSTHDIRRLLAQEKYDSCREQGMSKQESLAVTSKFLNHITPRERMLTKSYIIIH